jgi:uncharacterized protein (DUF927 family)
VTAPKLKSDQASTAKARSKSIDNTMSTPPRGTVQILGEGKNKRGQRFIKLKVAGNNKPLIVSHRDLMSPKSDVYGELGDRGARLISSKSRTNLLNVIQDYKPDRPLFNVVEEIGLFEDCFILPNCTIPKLPEGVEKCLDHIDYDIRAKYKCAGTLKGWQELAGYALRNSRMMLAFALNFVGPVFAIWPQQTVAFQFTGDGDCGKSAVAVVSTSVWGWDRNKDQGKKYGFDLVEPNGQ